MRAKGMTSRVLHADRLSEPEHGSLHKPIHTSVAFGYDRAEDLAAVFQNKAKGFAYARQGNPTVAALELKLAAMDDGVGTICFGTGMAAIACICLSLLKKGDHIVSSAYLFGNTNSLLNTLERLGLEVSFVDATRAQNAAAALLPTTRLVLVETIANPVTQVADLEGIGELCQKRGLIYLVDNTMTTPYLFLPKTVGATFSLHSLTKYLGGHGDALGGSVTDCGNFDWGRFANILDTYKKKEPATWGLLQLKKKGLRDFGPALSPEDAHRIALGMETLGLRMERACGNALKLAEYLAGHPRVSKVNYPGLPAHPQYDRVRRLFHLPGALLSFVLKDGSDCMEVLNKLELVINSSNLGDNRTLGIPVAHTIYFEMGPERRRSMGIEESLIRISVGIEETDDLLEDFERALA